MENRSILNTFVIPGIIVLIAAFSRLMPHPANFAVIGALALFSGAHMPKGYNIILPLIAMFLSDIFLGFHATMPFVYFSFLLIVFIGQWLHKRVEFKNIILASFVSSIIFYLITNSGVWTTSTMYAKTLSGLLECYVMALPYFRNTVLGDLIYSLILFYSYRVVTVRKFITI